MKDKVNTAMDRYELEAFKRENRLAENDYVFIRKMIDAFSRTREVNLIYIYGPSGAGKTFLLYSLFAALENAGNSNVLLYRMPDFIDELVRAIQSGTYKEFTQRFYYADAVLFDDVNKLVHKPTTQEEFERILNHYLEACNKLIIITGSCSPDDLKLTKRIRNRLLWGKVIELKCGSTGQRV